jgi:hypothetical protein
VTNKATPEAISYLKNIWNEVMSGDPLNAFLTRMKDAATRNDGKSQLGLVRIRYETGGEMSLKDGGDQVTVQLKHSMKK